MNIFARTLPSLSYSLSFSAYRPHRDLHSFPTRRSSDLPDARHGAYPHHTRRHAAHPVGDHPSERLPFQPSSRRGGRSEEHTSELQSRLHLVCRLLLEKKNSQTLQIQHRELSLRSPYTTR